MNASIDRISLIDRIKDIEDACDASLASKFPDGKWIVIRVDGRGFSKLTRKFFEKPFDQKFHNAMIVSTESALKDLAGCFAHTHSDEASIILLPTCDVFGRRTQKMLSIASGIVSSVFSLQISKPAHFDARAIWFDDVNGVLEYFASRHSSSETNALNDFAYWTLKRLNHESFTGYSSKMTSMSINDRRRMLCDLGEDPVSKIPLWASYGTMLSFESFMKNTEIGPVQRRRITAQECPASRNCFVSGLKKILCIGDRDEKESVGASDQAQSNC